VIVLVVLPTWILLVSLVIGLCAAARAGDVQLVQAPVASSGSAWEATGASMPGAYAPVHIEARAGARGARDARSDARAPLAQREGVAA